MLTNLGYQSRTNLYLPKATWDLHWKLICLTFPLSTMNSFWASLVKLLTNARLFSGWRKRKLLGSVSHICFLNASQFYAEVSFLAKTRLVLNSHTRPTYQRQKVCSAWKRCTPSSILSVESLFLFLGVAVVMSALSLGSTDGVERVIHRFSQKQALPSYLFAIAVGDIIKGDLG